MAGLDDLDIPTPGFYQYWHGSGPVIWQGHGPECIISRQGAGSEVTWAFTCRLQCGEERTLEMSSQPFGRPDSDRVFYRAYLSCVPRE